MSIIDLSYLCVFILFVHITESKVVILRDYDDEPLFIKHEDRSSPEDIKHTKHFITGSNYKPKRTRSSKQAILHYGRHVYHLDNFDDLTKLRSEFAQLNPAYISYDYVDLNDLYRSSDTRNVPLDFLKDIVIFSGTPIHIRCKGKECDEDLRKFGTIGDDSIWKLKKMPLGHMKRFQIVDNSKKHKDKESGKPKPKYSEQTSSEEYHKKKKPKANKKKKYSYESSSESKESRETSSVEKSIESWEVKKNYYESNSVSSEESKEYSNKRPKKYEYSSHESQKNDIDQLESIEDIYKIKKKKKSYSHDDSDETTRKPIKDDMYLQGNKLYRFKESRNKKKKDEDKRRRLQHFLPKRYHWDPEDIHQLGYYWFNGPKGKYPDPKSLIAY